MLISELDLYKREWLELVFSGRNKQYGAYELRSTSNNITSRALGITLGLFIAASAVVTYASTHKKPADAIIMTEVPTIPPPELEEKVLEKPKVEPKQPQAAKPLATPQASVNMQRYVKMVAVPDNLAEDVKELEQNIAVGPVDAKGTTDAVNVDIPGDDKGVIGGKGDAVTEDNTPFDAVEFMPQPTGGEGAWAKFLQKNLRYPAAARENDQSGKVFISFIVERDGKLSDIQVLRKAGFGFDEEALRVLKMAPAWKPGIQNGKAVRVRFTIPINFQLSNE